MRILWYESINCPNYLFSCVSLLFLSNWLIILQIRKMDLEARGLQPNVKAVLLAKLREFKSDLNNLKTTVKRIESTNLNQAARDELLEAGMADTLTVCIYIIGRWKFNFSVNFPVQFFFRCCFGSLSLNHLLNKNMSEKCPTSPWSLMSVEFFELALN